MGKGLSKDSKKLSWSGKSAKQGLDDVATVNFLQRPGITLESAIIRKGNIQSIPTSILDCLENNLSLQTSLTCLNLSKNSLGSLPDALFACGVYFLLLALTSSELGNFERF